MSAFQYRAFAPDGGEVRGIVHADSARQARAALRSRGLLPAAVDRLGPQAQGRRIPDEALPLVTRELATLLDAGVALDLALAGMEAQAASATLREVLGGLREGLRGGASLAAAMAQWPASFPQHYREVVDGGERAGALPAVLEHLADYLDARRALRQRVQLALLYPAIVTTVALLVTAGLLAWVVPQVVEVYRGTGQALPLPTRVLIGASDLLRSGWPLLLAALAGGALAVRAAWVLPSWRLRLDRALLRVPALAPMLRAADTARLAWTLSVLLRGGVPLLAALDTAAGTLANRALGEAVRAAAERVRDGASLSAALAEGRAYPPALVHLCASGEASGRLDTMLARAAGIEKRALEQRLSAWLAAFEPALVLAMGALVVAILLAVMLPILELNRIVR